MTERAIQRDVVQLYFAIGAYVISTSQYRPSRVAPGLPDLIVLLPRKRGILLHEVKAKGGKQSAAQREFQTYCEEAGVRYILGGTEEAHAALQELGIAA